MDRSDFGWKTSGSMVVLALSMLLFLMAAMPALASESSLDMADEAGQESRIFGLGLGLAPDYEGSDDYQGIPLLQIRYNLDNGMYLSVLGNTLRVNLLPDKQLHLGPILRFRAERDDVDNDRVDRLRKVDTAAELGVFGSIKIDRWNFMLSAAQDVEDSHDGFLVDLSGAYTIPFDKQAMLTLFASTSYASDDYMETYFEIDANNAARSGLKRFKAEGGIKDLAFGGAYQYNIDDHWGLLGVLRYARLLGDAEDSPVVDDEGDAGQVLGGVVVNYRF